MHRLATSAIALLLTVPAAASAQQTVDAGEFTLEGWDYATLYERDSWNVEDLIGREVSSLSDNETIGSVVDLVFGSDGELLALVAEIGGFWDIGDTHVSVPWSAVEIPEIGPVGVPVTEDTIADFDIFDYSGLPGTRIADQIVAEVAGEDLGAGLWRASDLLGDYVRIQGEASDDWLNYGYVSDLVVRDGEIAATVVNSVAAMGGGTYAYPPTLRPVGVNDRAGWNQTRGTYDIPILEGDASSLPDFERQRVGTMGPR